MSVFPDVKQEEMPNYIKVSQGIDKISADTSLGKLFDGIGETLDTTIKAVDWKLTQDVKERLRPEVDRIYENQGVNEVVSNVAAENPVVGPVPDKATAVANRVSQQSARLVEAYNQGKISESYFQDQIHTLSRTVRAEYPGYREVIDKEIAGMLNRDPANDVRKALLQDISAAATRARGEADKWQAYVKQNEGIIQIVAPEYFPNLAKGIPMSQIDVQYRVAQYKANEEKLKFGKANIEIRFADNKLTYEDTQQYATNLLTSTANQATRSFQTSFGSLDKIHKFITDRKASGGTFNPKELGELTAALEQLERHVETTIDGQLTELQTIEQNGVKTSYTIRGRINDATKEKQIREQAMFSVRQLKEAVTNQQLGIVAWNKAWMDVAGDNIAAKLIEKNPMAGVTLGIRRIGGDQIFNMMLANPQFADPMLKFINGIDISEIIAGKQNPNQPAPSMAAATQRDQDNKMEPQKINQLVQQRVKDGVAVLMDKTANAEITANAATYLFGTNNRNFAEQFKPDQRMILFQRLASPEVTARIEELSKANPQLMDNYRQWVGHTFKAVFKTSADTLKDHITSPGSDFVYKLTPEGTISWEATPGNTTSNRLGRPLEVPPQVVELNKALRLVNPILKSQGTDIKTVLTDLGVDFNAAKEPGFFEKIGKALGDYFSGDPFWKEDFGAPKAAPEKRSDLRMEGGNSQYAGLYNLISSGESNTKDPYNTLFGGKTEQLTNMTINEVLARQDKMKADGSESTALGKFQFLQKTLKTVMADLGLKGDEKFTPELQDQLAEALLKRRGLDKFMKGEMTASSFADALAGEWAALKRGDGTGAYDNVGSNKSRISQDRVVAELLKLRG